MCDSFGGKNTLHKQRHTFRVPADFPVVLVCVVAFQCVDHMNKGTRNNTVYGQLVLLPTCTESTRTFSLINSYFLQLVL